MNLVVNALAFYVVSYLVPGIVIANFQVLAVIAVVAIVVGVKAVTAYGLTRAMGHSQATALTLAASLAQIGEFSFILVAMGVDLAILPEAARDLVVAAALASILMNPLLFWMADRRMAAA